MIRNEQEAILKKILELSERGNIDENSYTNSFRRFLQQEQMNKKELEKIYSNVNKFLKQNKKTEEIIVTSEEKGNLRENHQYA